MDIKKINLEKLTGQKQKQAEKAPFVPLADNKEVDVKVVDKIRNAKAAYALATLMATGALQSCIEQDVRVDHDEILALIEKQNDIFNKMSEQNQTIIDLLMQNNQDNKEMIKILKDLVSQIRSDNTAIMKILNNVKAGVIDIAAAMDEIVNIAKASHANDEEFLAKLDAIIQGQGTQNEKLDDILDANEEQNQLLMNIAELISVVGDKVDKNGNNLSDIITKFYQEYQNGEMKQSELLKLIYEQVCKSNDLSHEQLKAIEKLQAQVQAGIISNSEGIAQMIELLSSIDNKLGDLGKAIEDLAGTDKELAETLKNFYGAYKGGEITEQQLLAEILKAIQNSNSADASILAQLEAIQDAIISGSISAAEGLDKVTEILNKISDQIAGLGKAIEDLAGTDKELAEILKNFYGAYKGGEITEQQLLAEILKAMQNSNSMDAAILAQLEKIQDGVISGNISATEGLNKIAELLDKISGQIADLGKSIDALSLGNKELAEILKNFYGAYKGGEITEQQLLAEILKAIESQGSKDAEILGELQKIKDAIISGNISAKEGLGIIADILGRIETNTAAILNSVDSIAGLVNTLTVKFDNHNDEVIDQLKNLNKGTGSIDSKLDKVISNQEKSNTTLLAILGAIDLAKAELGEINDKTFNKQELKEILGPLFDKVADKFGSINLGDGNGISKEDLIEILDMYKVDLTKTNALIETQTSVIQNLKLPSGGSGTVNIVLDEVVDIMNQIRNDANADRAKLNKMLQEALDKLGSIDANGEAGVDALKALLATANQIKDNQDDMMDLAKANGTKFFNEVKNISNGVGDIAEMLESAKDYTEALAQAEKTRQQQNAILQAILEKEGTPSTGGNGNQISIDDLKKLIPDYTNILNEISDKIGKIVTSDDLEEFFVNNQTDLTKTNALIETLTSVVQNKKFTASGGGSADMSRVESLLGNIIDILNAGKQPTQAQMQELINAANKVVANTTANSSTRGIDPKVVAALNDIQEQVYNQTGQKGTYLHPGWIYSHLS